MTQNFSELLKISAVCLENFHCTQRYYYFSVIWYQKKSGLLINFRIAMLPSYRGFSLSGFQLQLLSNILVFNVLIFPYLLLKYFLYMWVVTAKMFAHLHKNYIYVQLELQSKQGHASAVLVTSSTNITGKHLFMANVCNNKIILLVSHLCFNITQKGQMILQDFGLYKKIL